MAELRLIEDHFWEFKIVEQFEQAFLDFFGVFDLGLGLGDVRVEVLDWADLGAIAESLVQEVDAVQNIVGLLQLFDGLF